jgi:hypothetical protein
MRASEISVPPIPTEVEQPKGKTVLQGFHREAKQWISLTVIDEDEDDEAALMSCHSKTQPFKKRLSIVWDDFSAFKIEGFFNIRWYRP